jgi:hypothetical protein
MKRIVTVVLGVMGAALVGCSSSNGGKAAGQAKSPGLSDSAVVERTADGVKVSDEVSASATVVAIDHKKRTVTLRGPEGNQETFTVGPEVRNLPQVRKGDQVVATYYESVALKLRKPGEATPGVVAAEDAVTAPPGSMPGAAAGQTVNVTATVQKVDHRKQTVTLKGPQGKLVTVKVQDPERLKKVKVNDLVEVTYTEAVAIAVERPTKTK